jgi:hypothetical protein
MEDFSTKKPDWAKEPEKLSFKVVNEPLEGVANAILNQIQREKKDKFHFLLHGLLTTSFQTYKATRKLVVKAPKFPAQAHILVRSLIDTLFTIVLLTQDTDENTRKYGMAGWRDMWLELERELRRYGNDSESKQYRDAKKKFLDSWADILQLSQDERTNPEKNIPYWPIPSQVLRRKIVSKADLKFLAEIYDWHYKSSSGMSHIAWAGMSAGVYATVPEKHWHPGKFESDAVYEAILFLLMILSEIEAICKFGHIQKLRYVWTIIMQYFRGAGEYYKTRYDTLLREEI